jgi:hypothetical protein
MGLLKGNANIIRLRIKESVPSVTDESWVSKLKENAFVGPASLEDVYGWSVAGNELETEFTFENATVGKFVVFSLRVDSIQLPKSYLKLAIERAIQKELLSPEVEVVSRKRRAEIKEDITQSLVDSAHPNVKTVQVAVDTQTKYVYFGSSSSKMVDYFQVLFARTFDMSLVICDGVDQVVRIKGEEEAPKLLDSRTSISLTDEPAENTTWEMDLACSFTTWLAYITDQSGTYSYKSREYGAMIAEEIGLELLGDTGCGQKTVLKKGNVVAYPEFGSAIASGKLINRVKLEIALEEESWTFSLNAHKEGIQGIKAPKPQEGDNFQKTIYRLQSLCEVFEVIDNLYEQFVDFMYGEDHEKILLNIKGWAKK